MDAVLVRMELPGHVREPAKPHHPPLRLTHQTQAEVLLAVPQRVFVPARLYTPWRVWINLINNLHMPRPVGFGEGA